MIRMALIGCGGMSRAYLRQMEPLADRMRFTALVDVDPQRAADAASASPVCDGAQTFTDYRQCIGDIDAAILTLPHHLHRPIGVDLMAAGKHVLIEKPIANTERDCLDLIEAADRAGVVAMHGYVLRYSPIIQTFGRLLRDAEHGQCFHLSIWTEQYTDTTGRPWLGRVAELGGGQLFSHGCHYIDLLLHWLGPPETGTHVGTNRATPWMEMEGTSNVAMRFANHATAYHFGTWGARGSKLHYSFHAHCEGGMLELDYRAGAINLHLDPSRGDLGGMSRQQIRDADARESCRTLYTQDGRSRKHTEASVAHFLDCIETGSTPDTDLRSGLQSLRAIWRLYDAESRGIVADLTGLGLNQFTPTPDPILAQAKRFGHTCDPAALLSSTSARFIPTTPTPPSNSDQHAT